MATHKRKLMNINRLITYRKGLRVERFHTVPHITSYSNGHHSANAALIAHDLCLLNDIDSKDLIIYMLMHDVAEQYVGDVPANAKIDNPYLKEAMGVAETYWEGQYLPNVPGLSKQEACLARVSDLAELGMYCLEELDMGNSNVLPTIDKVVEYLLPISELGFAGVHELMMHIKLGGEHYVS